MNVLDIILIIPFIPGLIRGLSKGFLEQVLSLAGIVLGVWLAYRFSAPVGEQIAKHITLSDTMLHLVAFGSVLLIVLILVMMLSSLLSGLVNKTPLEWLDKALGFVFSCCVTALLVGLCIILFDTLNDKFQLVNPSVLEESMLYEPLRQLGYFVFPYLKQLFTQPEVATVV